MRTTSAVAACVALALLAGGCATAKKKAPPAAEPMEMEASMPEMQTVSVPEQPVVAEELPAVDPLKMSKSEVQVCLRNAGYYKGKVDGVFGPKTRAAIKAFQKDNGLQVDGLAGKQTRGALAKYLNK